MIILFMQSIESAISIQASEVDTENAYTADDRILLEIK